MDIQVHTWHRMWTGETSWKRVLPFRTRKIIPALTKTDVEKSEHSLHSSLFGCGEKLIRAPHNWDWLANALSAPSATSRARSYHTAVIRATSCSEVACLFFRDYRARQSSEKIAEGKERSQHRADNGAVAPSAGAFWSQKLRPSACSGRWKIASARHAG